MRNLRCWLVVLCLWSTLVVLLPACTDDPAAKDASDAAAVDRAGLCKQGGATFNAANNECLCPESQAWNGTGCGGVAALTAVHEELPAVAKDGAIDSAHPPVPPANETITPVSEKPSNERLKAVCEKAQARWLPDDGYCACPDRKVLIGSTCRKLAGRMIDDVCLRALNKGSWLNGGCDCPGETVFNAARGGCVLPVLSDQSTLKLSCESSLNNGHWESSNVRCLCPKGRVWVDELCQVQQLLASQDICQGAFNKGKWDLKKKRCRCPGGTLWFNQACLSPKALTLKQACTSEGNSGQWDNERNGCTCPAQMKWNAQAKVCK